MRKIGFKPFFSYKLLDVIPNNEYNYKRCQDEKKN